MTKVIWALSAVVAVSLGLLLPTPALFGGHPSKFIVVEQAANAAASVR